MRIDRGISLKLVGKAIWDKSNHMVLTSIANSYGYSSVKVSTDFGNLTKENERAIKTTLNNAVFTQMGYYYHMRIAARGQTTLKRMAIIVFSPPVKVLEFRSPYI